MPVNISIIITIESGISHSALSLSLEPSHGFNFYDDWNALVLCGLIAIVLVMSSETSLNLLLKNISSMPEILKSAEAYCFPY